MRRRVGGVVVLVAVAAAAVAISAGPAGAADECNGLRVCLPVAGPWVVIPAGGVVYELACPLAGYVVAGTDARVAARDVDVSFRAETGSPVGPGVSTRRSVVFQAHRTRIGAGPTSFRPFIGCIPTRGGGGRALTSYSVATPGSKPSRPVRSIAVTRPVRRTALLVRVSCPSGSRLIGSSAAVAFRQKLAPAGAMLGAVTVARSVVDGAVVAKVTATAARGPHAEVQVRALCARAS